MIVKIEIYFEVVPARKGADLQLEFLRNFLKEELGRKPFEADFDESDPSYKSIRQLSEQEAFQKLSTSLRAK